MLAASDRMLLPCQCSMLLSRRSGLAWTIPCLNKTTSTAEGSSGPPETTHCSGSASKTCRQAALFFTVSSLMAVRTDLAPSIRHCSRKAIKQFSRTTSPAGQTISPLSPALSPATRTSSCACSRIWTTWLMRPVTAPTPPQLTFQTSNWQGVRQALTFRRMASSS